MLAYQNIDRAENQAEAEEVLRFLSSQVGYMGGRILPPSPSSPRWRVQTFHHRTPNDPVSLLPDGVRPVTIVPSQCRALGIIA